MLNTIYQKNKQHLINVLNILKIDKIYLYISLMRLNKLTCSLLALYPVFFGVLISSDNIEWLTLIKLSIGTIVLRSAGCVINDIFDRKIDAQVLRTKNRPIANGAVSVQEAYLITAILLFISFGVWLMLSFTAKIASLIALAFLITYPKTKLFFPYPQFFLGITFNFGLIVAILELLPLDQIKIYHIISYIAFVTWTIGYDTIYACQDKDYDKNLEVNSTALMPPHKIIYLIKSSFFTSGVLWAFVGGLLNLNSIYFIFWSIACYLLFKEYDSLNINDPKKCLFLFQLNNIIGMLLVAGLTLAKIFQ